MRLHSKFHDYYDTALGYGIDEQCHYVRKTIKFDKRTNEHKLTLDKFPRFPLFRKQLSGVIFFCGKSYFYFNMRLTKTIYMAPIETFIYSEEELNKYLEKVYGKKSNEYLNYFEKLDHYWLLKNQNQTIKKFELFQNISEQTILDLHREYESPIILIDQNKLVINPVLKDYQFFKVSNPYETFQEISMFISGVLGGSSPTMVKLDDKYLIQKHGFNKLSFRKGKEK